jgi:hypothetical protein
MADEHERLIGDTYRLAILLRNAGAVKRYHVVRTLRAATTQCSLDDSSRDARHARVENW